MVNGENDHLANPLVASRVRAALFAGIRSAFLWQQKGGRRWHLLIFRRRIAQAASGAHSPNRGPVSLCGNQTVRTS